MYHPLKLGKKKKKKLALLLINSSLLNEAKVDCLLGFYTRGDVCNTLLL